MNNYIQYFQTFLHTAFALYFGHESEYASLRDIPLPEGEWLASIIGEEPEPEEQVVLMLALMPHISPQALDLFFIRDKNLDRPYTEFGGWRGTSHTGFLPTAETAAFILSIGDPVHWGKHQTAGALRMVDRSPETSPSGLTRSLLALPDTC